MYLLTKLSASQTATWHVYFRIHHTYKSILTIVKERHVGPLLKSRKSCSTWHAARCRPLGAVQKGLFLISYVQFNTAAPKPVWLVCWRPWWHPCGPSVELARSMMSSIPVNCLWGSAHSCCVALFTFSCPFAAQCWASTYVLPFQSHAGSQRKVQRAMK
jgi:hypothetical protein